MECPKNRPEIVKKRGNNRGHVAPLQVRKRIEIELVIEEKHLDLSRVATIKDVQRVEKRHRLETTKLEQKVRADLLLLQRERN